jgi:uncharacterized membrane protein (TIGR02234 family)
MNSGWLKSRGLALGCLVVGGALAMFASTQPWWRGLGEGVAVKVTGTQATAGLSQALAIVALAGTLLLLGLRGRGRRVLGGVLLLVGIGAALIGGFWMQPRADAVRGQLGHIGWLDSFRPIATAWPWVFLLAGALIAAGGALTMITAGSWASAADRFQPESGRAQHATSDEPAELWKAMDAGLDPTASGQTDDHDTLLVPDPEMRDPSAGDTMDGTEQAQQLPWAPPSPHIGNSTGQVQQGRGEREV